MLSVVAQGLPRRLQIAASDDRWLNNEWDAIWSNKLSPGPVHLLVRVEERPHWLSYVHWPRTSPFDTVSDILHPLPFMAANVLNLIPGLSRLVVFNEEIVVDPSDIGEDPALMWLANIGEDNSDGDVSMAVIASRVGETLDGQITSWGEAWH